MFTGSHWLDAGSSTSFSSRRRNIAYSGQRSNQRMCSPSLCGLSPSPASSSPRFLLLAAPYSHAPLQFMHHGLYGAFWFLLKVSAYIYVFIWLRVTLPRFRFDQLMRMGWHILIPLGLINIV